jgi:hypothetical protein
LLSLQFTAVLTHKPVLVSQLAVLQALLVQTTGVNEQPVALLHESIVHFRLSLQSTGVCTQPVAVLQLATEQALVALQTTGVYWQPTLGGTRTAQESVVQALLSLQEAISAAVQQDCPVPSQMLHQS